LKCETSACRDVHTGDVTGATALADVAKYRDVPLWSKTDRPPARFVFRPTRDAASHPNGAFQLS
jgi:hypothetical protein